MIYLGTITNINGGIWVQIRALSAEYGPLTHLGLPSEYAKGDRVALANVGPDEYIVLGVVHP